MMQITIDLLRDRAIHTLDTVSPTPPTHECLQPVFYEFARWVRAKRTQPTIAANN
jgi:hypothetical protein